MSGSKAPLACDENDFVNGAMIEISLGFYTVKTNKFAMLTHITCVSLLYLDSL